ncbi:MAG: hypothetical protein KDD44_02790 [Bdellovibrionales bacterium]|nr:hypothetical protein [Bdellovibrionales bacterium]
MNDLRALPWNDETAPGVERVVPTYLQMRTDESRRVCPLPLTFRQRVRIALTMPAWIILGDNGYERAALRARRLVDREVLDAWLDHWELWRKCQDECYVAPCSVDRVGGFTDYRQASALFRERVSTLPAREMPRKLSWGLQAPLLALIYIAWTVAIPGWVMLTEAFLNSPRTAEGGVVPMLALALPCLALLVLVLKENDSYESL